MTIAEWRFSAQLAFYDPFIRWASFLALLVATVTSAYMLFRLVPEGLRSGVTVFHYTIYLGIDDVRNWVWVSVFPVGLYTVFIFNTVFALGLYRLDVLAARTLTGLATTIIIIASISSFFLVRINI
jgi:hypothetical protein